MPRQKRIVIPGLPHHIVQRGVRRMPVFFKPNDYRFYLDLLKEWAVQAELQIWAYCLMPNHVHIIAVPGHEDSLRLSMSQTHRRYTQMINRREEGYGHLWQSRFLSYPIDNDPYLLSAVRYVELNPVTAQIVSNAGEYEWSSARAHLFRRPDEMLRDNRLTEIVSDWASFLNIEEHPAVQRELRKVSGMG